MNINLKRYIDNAIKREVRRSMLRVSGRQNDALPVSPEAMMSAQKYIRTCLARLHYLDMQDLSLHGYVPQELKQEFKQCRLSLEKAFIGERIGGIGIENVNESIIHETKNHLKMALHYSNSMIRHLPPHLQSYERDTSSLIEKAIIRLS